MGGTSNIGVYGTVPDTTTNNWAGYFRGKVQIEGNLWHNLTFIFSDENLKTDINEVTGEEATALLAQLAPKSYTYNTAEFPQMNFSGTTQYGFLAQDVQEVLPELVGTTHVMEVTDSTGAVITAGMDVSGVNYVGLIPLLVAGYQAANERTEALEQQLAEQDDRLAHLEELLAACCASPTGDDQRIRMEETGAGTGADRLLRIQPNPFSEPPTVFYALERAGRMQLMANSADGKQLRVLHEANQEAGQYQYNWNTTDLSPGMYYVTLLLDGEPIVKKAVKVQR